MQNVIPPLPFKDNPVKLRVRLDEKTYLMTLLFNERMQAFYMDLVGPSGATIVAGRRLTPFADPISGVVADTFTDPGDAPTGLFYVTGPDPYTRDDLGTRLRMIYVTANEVDQLLIRPGDAPTFREV